MLLNKLLGITITTDILGVAIPELLTKYGSGKTVSIKGAFINAPGKAKITDSLSSITANLALGIFVDGETAIKADCNGVTIAALINTVNNAVHGNISTHTIGEVSNFQSTLGIDASTFKT